jgi:uncharacterized OsmC-like protein
MSPETNRGDACPAPREVKVVVRGESENATRMNLTSGPFHLIIDEPEAMGGTHAGPSPIQVLLMALAGCLNVTGHEVARQRGLKLKGMKLRIEGVMNPCAFIGCSSEERAGFQHIRVVVDADMEDATPEAVAAWLEETERRCPVTDNIRADTAVSVSLH